MMPRRRTQVLLYLVPSKYLFQPNSQARSSEITFLVTLLALFNCGTHIFNSLSAFDTEEGFLHTTSCETNT